MMPNGSERVTVSVETVQAQVRAAVSQRPRVLYTLCMVLDVGVLILVAALWSTEPNLPTRTHAAFGAMSALGVAWLVFFCWVLLYKRPLYALDRVLAGKLAVVGSALFLTGGVTVAVQRGGWHGITAVSATGGAFLAAAVVLLWRGVRARRELLHRREELMVQTNIEV